MQIRPLKTDADYRAALREVELLMAAREDTKEGDRLDVLVTLVEAYERKHFPMDAPDPIAAIEFAMEKDGLTPKDLTPMIGALNRVYEVLRRRRPLSLRMIRALHEKLGIPAESLLKAQKKRRAASQSRALKNSRAYGAAAAVSAGAEAAAALASANSSSR